MRNLSRMCSANKTQNIKGLLESFSESTTIHGWKRLVRAQSLTWRLFWTVACVSATVTFIFMYGQLIHKYRSHPARTVVEVKRESIEFPDVTICPLRVLDISIIKSLFDLSMDTNPGATSTRHPYDILKSNDSRVQQEFVNAYYALTGQYYHLYRKYYRSNSSLFNEVMSRTNLLPNTEVDVLLRAKVPTWEVLLNCRWRGSACDRNRMSTLYDPYFVNCVTFEPERDQIISEGVETGLSVVGIYGSGMVNWKEYLNAVSYPILIVGLTEYGHPLSGDQGARVVLHRHGSPPMPSEEGFNIPPGFSVSIGISFQTIFELGEPYSTCSDADQRAGRDETYRLLPCLRRCIQEQVVNECHCVDARLPLLFNMTANDMNGLKFCGQIKPLPPECTYEVNTDPPIECLQPLAEASRRIECGKNVQKRLEKEEGLMEICKCYAPCEDIKYTVEYSVSKWPPGPEMDSIYMEVMSDFQAKLQESKPSPMKAELYREHFGFSNRFKAFEDMSKINVHVADTSVVKIIQKPDYTSSDLLSDVGGQLGLWIGMSVLSFGELIQLVCDIWFCVWAKKNKHGKTIAVKPAETKESEKDKTNHDVKE